MATNLSYPASGRKEDSRPNPCPQAHADEGTAMTFHCAACYPGFKTTALLDLLAHLLHEHGIACSATLKAGGIENRPVTRQEVEE